MKIKQFKTGPEAKFCISKLKEYYENDIALESYECKGIEIGFVLHEALNNFDVESIDIIKLLNFKLEMPNDFPKHEKTIKFKLEDEDFEKINFIKDYYSKKLKLRLYPSFAVRVSLKNSYMKIFNLNY